jgi:hypothetical protein
MLGPGAIVASLTIGSGELVFSTRAGALFGYRILGLFALILLLKWALVILSGQLWLRTGQHPFRLWMELPGPRGWLPMVFFALAAGAFPLWVGFHAGTVGGLIAALTQTSDAASGSGAVLWGMIALAGVILLAFTGSYARLEGIQTAIVALMLLCVLAALFFLRPDWSAFIAGFGQFGRLSYPDWARDIPELANRSVWLEAANYAGVLGGGGYDYLAYITWLRNKHGMTLAQAQTQSALGNLVAAEATRLWLRRTLLADATVSFSAVLVFTAVFVACGTLVLGPRQQIPAGTNLLALQAQFVGAVSSALTPLYFIGAFLAIFGTLYGTIEVAPAILRECVAAWASPRLSPEHPRVRRWAVVWCSIGGMAVLVITWLQRVATPSTHPLQLTALLTPANLFTGVMACGIVALLNVAFSWPHPFARSFRRVALLGLNAVGGLLFLALGLKGYWDYGNGLGLLVLAATLAGGILGAHLSARWFRPG